MRWIVSHTLRYPVFPLGMLLAVILNNIFHSNIQVFIGRGFDLITAPGWVDGAIARPRCWDLRWVWQVARLDKA